MLFLLLLRLLLLLLLLMPPLYVPLLPCALQVLQLHIQHLQLLL
jgi:hypothetical protein